MNSGSAVKNWDAQARTNTVLAASIKQLRDEVVELRTLLAWRDDVNDQLQQMVDEIDAVRSTATARGKLGRGASFRGVGQMLLRGPSLMRQASGNLGLQGSKSIGRNNQVAPGGGEGRGAAAPAQGASRVQMYWKPVLLILALVFQACMSAPILYEEWENGSDDAQQWMSSILSGALVLSGFFGIIGVGKEGLRLLAAFGAFEAWIVPLSLMYVMVAFSGISKVDKLCALDGVGCGDLEWGIYRRVIYGFVVALMSLVLTACTTALRDSLLHRNVMDAMPLRLRMALRHAAASAPQVEEGEGLQRQGSRVEASAAQLVKTVSMKMASMGRSQRNLAASVLKRQQSVDPE
ncbi:unnamed protein product [Pedinophyceae sp. YPF-701]|nr:unnamed protein product [Pedinophyceae sp. YPF-701]